MYGKIFEEIFDSTIAEFGGDTVYTFIAMVVKSDAKGYLRMTSTAIARTIGKDVHSVNVAIANLEADDPDSSSLDHNGRRIISLKELTNSVENRGWWVVNKEKYAKIAKQKDRTIQNKEAQQRKRDKDKHQSAGVSNSQQSSSVFGHEDEDVDVDLHEDIYPDFNQAEQKHFRKWIANYPRQQNQKKAFEEWCRQSLDPLVETLIADVHNRVNNDAQWQNSQFIPNPDKYLRDKRWTDDILKTQPQKKQKAKAPQSSAHTNWIEYGLKNNIPRLPQENISEYIVRVKAHRDSVSCETKKADTK